MPRDEHSALRDGILRECGLYPPVVPLSAPDAAMRLLACARVASVDNREVYYAPAAGLASMVTVAPIKGERDAVAVSPRNETAACALVLELLSEAGAAAAAVLPAARALCDAALAPPDTHPAPPSAAPPDDAGVGDAMVAWVRGGAGAAAAPAATDSADISIVPARFPVTGRGAAAAVDIPAGADALRVPSRALWTVQVAFDDQGPRGEAYRTFAALGEDTIAALWLVRENSLGDASPWAPLLKTLPLRADPNGDGFGPTPMSWPLDAVHALLGGTQLHADATAARDTLGRQYAALFPALSDHMSEVFPRELYTPENFRAATEAWNSYGMTVQAETGEGGEVPAPATCLPPVALLCNHSTWPHAVRYSRLRGDALHLPIARTVRKGEEVFVSYGAKSNAELLLFYGFTVDGNPYDDVPLSLELPGGEVAEVTRAREAALARFGLSLSPHAVRAGTLSTSLVGTLRVLTADAAALSTCSSDPRTAPVSSEGEAAAAAALCGALGALLEQLEGGDEAARVWESNAEARFREVAGASAGSESGSGSAGAPAGEGGVRAAATAAREARIYREGVRRTLQTAMGEARAWRAAVGGGPDPALGKRTRD